MEVLTQSCPRLSSALCHRLQIKTPLGLCQVPLSSVAHFTLVQGLFNSMVFLWIQDAFST